MQMWPSKSGCLCSRVLRKSFKMWGKKKKDRYGRNSRLSLSRVSTLNSNKWGHLHVRAAILFTERDNVLHGKNNWIPWSPCVVLGLPRAETPRKWKHTRANNKWFIVKIAVHGNSEENEQSGSGRTGMDSRQFQDLSHRFFCEFSLVSDSATHCVSATLHALLPGFLTIYCVCVFWIIGSAYS